MKCTGIIREASFLQQYAVDPVPEEKIDNDTEDEPANQQAVQFFCGNIHGSAGFAVVVPFKKRIQKDKELLLLLLFKTVK